jgi:hypothetical protein
LHVYWDGVVDAVDVDADVVIVALAADGTPRQDLFSATLSKPTATTQEEQIDISVPATTVAIEPDDAIAISLRGVSAAPGDHWITLEDNLTVVGARCIP